MLVYWILQEKKLLLFIKWLMQYSCVIHEKWQTLPRPQVSPILPAAPKWALPSLPSWEVQYKQAQRSLATRQPSFLKVWMQPLWHMRCKKIRQKILFPEFQIIKLAIRKKSILYQYTLSWKIILLWHGYWFMSISIYMTLQEIECAFMYHRLSFWLKQNILHFDANQTYYLKNACKHACLVK